MQREDGTHQAGGGRGRGGRPRGFTLIELLVVILILGILVGLVVGVGRSVMIEMAKRRTESIQKIVLNAIRVYRDAREYYPAQMASIPPEPTDPATESGFYGYRSGTGWPAKCRISDLYQQLVDEPASAKAIAGLPPEAVYTPTQPFRGTTGTYRTIRDGFDYDMDYLRTALGPVILSPGPDGKWGGTGGIYDNDNIRSDRGGQ